MVFKFFTEGCSVVISQEENENKIGRDVSEHVVESCLLKVDKASTKSDY